jgi:hypothetical protein
MGRAARDGRMRPASLRALYEHNALS